MSLSQNEMHQSLSNTAPKYLLLNNLLHRRLYLGTIAQIFTFKVILHHFLNLAILI